MENIQVTPMKKITNKLSTNQQEEDGQISIAIEDKITDHKINFILTPEEAESYIEANQGFYNSINTFEFDIFKFTKAIGRNMQMPILAVSLFKQNNLLQCINQPKFLAFISQIYNKYKRNVAYHNDLHGSDVAQHCSYILNAQNLKHHADFNQQDTLSILVAALCHDVDHDGFNNSYHLNTQSRLYQMYGEVQIQENNHVAQTIQLLDDNNFDFLTQNFEPSQVVTIKKRIIESILFTDMAQMGELRNQFEKHLQVSGVQKGENVANLIDTSTPQTVEHSKQLVSNVLLHACDISTSLRSFDKSTQWTDLLFKEFFNQGDTEKAMGIPVSQMCDRQATRIAAGQNGFITFVVLPIFQQLSNICPEIEEKQIAEGINNMDKWTIKAKIEQ